MSSVVNYFSVSLLFFTYTLTSGCSYSVKGTDYDKITGESYLTQVDTVLFNYLCPSWGGRLMLRSGDFSSPCKGADIKVIPKHTMITVADVIKISTPGFSCWRVLMKIDHVEDHQLVDIPSCSLHHPRPSWMVTSNPFDDGFMEFKSDKLKKVKGLSAFIYK